jgi:hypothetical protein
MHFVVLALDEERRKSLPSQLPGSPSVSAGHDVTWLDKRRSDGRVGAPAL